MKNEIKYNLIVALDENDGIGNLDGSLPWPKHKADMTWFRMNTDGCIVIIGRKTYESFNKAPLKNRHNIVLTSYPPVNDFSTNLWFSTTKNHAVYLAESISADYDLNKPVWIIGGLQVYKQFLPEVDEIYLTRMHTVTSAEIKMPLGWLDGAQMLGHAGPIADDPSGIPYSFERYKLIRAHQ